MSVDHDWRDSRFMADHPVTTVPTVATWQTCLKLAPSLAPPSHCMACGEVLRGFRALYIELVANPCGLVTGQAECQREYQGGDEAASYG
jgi:hypothetical protein